MSIGRICRREVWLADAKEGARAAAQRMREHNVGTLVVLDEMRRPVGIVTDRDLTLRVHAEGRDPDRTPTAAVMSPAPRTVTEDTAIETALAIMRSGRFRRLPVVGEGGALVGLVSLDDILELLAEELHEVGGLLLSEEPHD